MINIICGFPGIGKSTLVAQGRTGFKFSDSDSSRFSKYPSFPLNYTAYILTEVLNDRTVLASTHQQVRARLHQLGVGFLIVLPEPGPESKIAYMQRYRDRGSPQPFLDLMDREFEEFVAQCMLDPAPKHFLAPDRYLGDDWMWVQEKLLKA